MSLKKQHWTTSHAKPLSDESPHSAEGVGVVFAFVGTLLAAEPAFDGGKSTWHDGFVRYDFVMDDETLVLTPFTRPEKEGFAVGLPP